MSWNVSSGIVSNVIALTVDDSDDFVQHFTVGERVTIESDVDTAIALQEGHGGWNDAMRKVCKWLSPLFSATNALLSPLANRTTNL